MYTLRQEILPPSGVEYVASLKLTPATVTAPGFSASLDGPSRRDFTTRSICNLVVARSNLLRIFEVREELASIPFDDDSGKRSRMRRGTEAVEGEVEMDEQGEGFVNMGTVKSTTQPSPPVTVRLYFVREHHLHGIVTGMESVRLVMSGEDGLDRLLVSFKDAKIALLEWSEAIHDLLTVSIHTYERAPQLLALDSNLFRAQLRVDPISRCAALSLPQDAMAILPFSHAQVELDGMDQDQSQSRDIPYFPSFILDFSGEVDEGIHNVIDFVFLPGFNNPTVAVLFQPQQTWTGRLKEYKDTVKLVIFTLDLATHHYPVITSAEGLPYDCMSMLPCATSIGGVLILASNSLIYVDQAARRVALPVNGWAARTSDLPFQALSPEEQECKLELEGCRAAFVSDRTAFLLLTDGSVFRLELITDGKTVAKLTLSPALARTTIPTVVKPVGDEFLFVGSTVGPSVLLKSVPVEEFRGGSGMAAAPSAVVDVRAPMTLEDDDDIYGVPNLHVERTTNGIQDGENAPKKTRTVMNLCLCDSLAGYGSISDATFSLAKNGDRYVPELVTVTGSGHLGGFTLFQRDLPINTKRKLHAIGGARGMWSLPVRQSVKASTVSYHKPTDPYQPENDSVILSTDANPSPGLSRIATRSSRHDITITMRIPGTTVGAGTLFQKTVILHVMTNCIRVLEPDGTEKQNIKDADGNMPRPKIKACSICDPFVLILREDDTIGLFVGEPERGKIRRKDMSPMGEKSSRYLAGCFFTDSNGRLETFSGSASGEQNVTTTLQAALTPGNSKQYLLLIRPQGIMEIWTLPKLMLVFSTPLLSRLQNVLTDSLDLPTVSSWQDFQRQVHDTDIDQVTVAPLGKNSPRLHLLVLLRSGQLAVYEIHPANRQDAMPSSSRASLLVRFVKVHSKAFEIQRAEEAEKSILAEQKRISRLFIPFTTSPTPGVTYSGVFFTGDRPSWILATDKSGVKIHPSGHSVVHSFTACSLWDSKGDFLVYSDEGPSLLEWIPDVQIWTDLPSRSIPSPRPYSHVIFDANTSLIVAASALKSNFISYDEEGNKVWEREASNLSEPLCDCSCLELLSPDLWITMDGYEFAQNEFVTALDCVTLETSGTEAGTKQFIAAGTTINRGEDLAAKGSTYIFEIVEVVPDRNSELKRSYKLKLRFRDDPKGPVTAICGFNGYLVSSMGQKIFVRALDLDERLVGVAFLDVGVYVTSLHTLKNLLVIGDAVKSVWFVAFQEDPYKLLVVAKDVRRLCITVADFLFADGDMSIVSGDEEGVLRVYSYDPSSPEAKNGQHLLCRTEFHGHVESRSSVVIARRNKPDAEVPYTKLFHAHSDGSLTSLTSVSESVFKRFQLLQGQLTRNVQHFAGLNPKAFRIVKNDSVSKPLSKGLLDGNLLAAFESLPITKQDEVTRQIGTERTVVLRDWISLRAPW